MVRKIGNFPYDISKFEKETEKLFPNEDIVVGAMNEADEGIIQQFFENVLKYEINDRKLNKKKQNT